MTSKPDEVTSAEDERFVRAVDALYQPPEPTAAARARFAVRLDARIARGASRRSWRLAGATAAAAALALLVARLPLETPGSSREPAGASAALSTDETLLWLANGPLEDPDDALPADYQTLASLLE